MNSQTLSFSWNSTILVLFRQMHIILEEGSNWLGENQRRAGEWLQKSEKKAGEQFQKSEKKAGDYLRESEKKGSEYLNKRRQ